MRWTALTALVGSMLLSGSYVNSLSLTEASDGRPSVTVDGCRVTATATANTDDQCVSVTFAMERPADGKRKTIDVPLELQLITFAGDPMSRVFSPGDANATTLEIGAVNIESSGKQPGEASWCIEVEKPEVTDGRGRYAVVAVVGDEKVELCSIPVGALWPIPGQIPTLGQVDGPIQVDLKRIPPPDAIENR